MIKKYTSCFSALLAAFTGLALISCSLKPVSKTRNIIYNATNDLKLDVYAPKRIKTPAKILVFIYGGNWVHGKKSIYRFFGKGMARKGIICVIPDYRLSPRTDNAGMALDVAGAIKWVKANGASFKGDTNNIFISGHSAGGELAALVAADTSYFVKQNLHQPLKGVILIDAFGLDMNSYLSNSSSLKDTLYYPTFSTDPVKWKKYSAVYYLNKNTAPMLQFVGTETYPAIQQQNNSFYDTLKTYQPDAVLIPVKGRKHVGMIFQFYMPHVHAYKEILSFMEHH